MKTKYRLIKLCTCRNAGLVQKLKSWYFIFFQVIKEEKQEMHCKLNKPLSKFKF